jgi:hypothetical protein
LEAASGSGSAGGAGDRVTGDGELVDVETDEFFGAQRPGPRHCSWRSLIVHSGAWLSAGDDDIAATSSLTTTWCTPSLATSRIASKRLALLAEAGQLRPDAADTTYALASPNTFRALVEDRHCSWNREPKTGSPTSSATRSCSTRPDRQHPRAGTSTSSQRSQLTAVRGAACVGVP